MAKTKAITAAAESAEAVATVKMTLVRSPIGYPERQKATVRALGFRRMNQTIEKADTPDNRSMAASISHLVRVEE